MKIQEHKRKYERKMEEKELQARKERVRKAKEAQEKARQVCGYVIRASGYKVLVRYVDMSLERVGTKCY